jgi:phospholipid/cholesterol/gamma-HCH transport system permease protein
MHVSALHADTLPPAPRAAATVERRGATAIVHVRGDLTIPAARAMHGCLRALARRRGVRTIVVDLTGAGRIDSAGAAALSLASRYAARADRRVELRGLGAQHREVLALIQETTPAPPEERTGILEQLGDRVLATGGGARAFASLVAGVMRAGARVVARRERLPDGAVVEQIAAMGVDALFIVGLLSLLLGMTMAFQGAVQLQRFGAGPFVADMVSMSMVRELAPLMTAVILTGRTGAAIAAELGTMQVRSEIDALRTMGIEPVRYLIVPRLAAITVAGPALTVMSMFVGIAGGMLVASLSLDLPAATFWQRAADRVTLGDFAHGLGKSLVFAWIIGLAGSHLGLRTGGDASSVGTATTRTVVTAIFFVIVVDAIFATISTVARHS